MSNRRIGLIDGYYNPWEMASLKCVSTYFEKNDLSDDREDYIDTDEYDQHVAKAIMSCGEDEVKFDNLSVLEIPDGKDYRVIYDSESDIATLVMGHNLEILYLGGSSISDRQKELTVFPSKEGK